MYYYYGTVYQSHIDIIPLIHLSVHNFFFQLVSVCLPIHSSVFFSTCPSIIIFSNIMYYIYLLLHVSLFVWKH